LMHNYIESKGVLTEEQLETSQTINGGGARNKFYDQEQYYKHKYMKYKSKYLMN